MKIKKLLSLLLAAPLLASCGIIDDMKDAAGDPGKKDTKATKVYVYAAASMTETLQQIETKYEKANKNVDLVFNFGSSGTLKDQIIAGGTCDLFISAAQKQMNALQDLDLINTESRVNLLENKVSLVVPETNTFNVQSFDNMATLLSAKTENFILAMGGADVPVGDYTKKILKHYGILNESGDFVDDQVEAHITYGEDVKDVCTKVQNLQASCGVIYRTDAFSEHLTEVAQATADMCGQVIYPAALIKATKQAKLAGNFLTYLKGAEASAIFESVGFTALSVA